MAVIDLPILPFRLYRYRSLTRDVDAFSQEIEAIISNKLYCSDFSSMNDPMEGFFHPSKGVDGNDNYTSALRRIFDAKTRVGISCFTESKEDMLMWTHYAGNHKGICISYSSRRLIEGLPHAASLVRVAYVDKAPNITSADLRNSVIGARKILSQKRQSWTGEREWRVLADRGLISIEGPLAAMSLYFGSRVSKPHRHKALLRLQGTNIRAYSMEVTGYEHHWMPINAAAKSAEDTSDQRSLF